MCDKAVNRGFFVFDSVPDWYKTQEMFDRVIYKYETQECMMKLLMIL